MPDSQEEIDTFPLVHPKVSAFLLQDCGIFVLSDSDSPQAVTRDVGFALRQHDKFEHLDAFHSIGGGRRVALKRLCEDNPEEGTLYQQGYRWTSEF